MTRRYMVGVHWCDAGDLYRVPLAARTARLVRAAHT